MENPAAPQPETQPRPTTWLQRTGQKRIVVFWLGVFAALCLILLLPLLGVPLHEIFGTDARWENNIFVIWLFVAVTFALLGLAFTLRCPKCKLNIVWYAISKVSSDAWLDYVSLMQECPRCGHTGFAPGEEVQQYTVSDVKQELTSVEAKPKPRLLKFTAWINALIIWGVLLLSIGHILLAEPTLNFTFRAFVDLLIVSTLIYAGESVINTKKWALLLLYSVFTLNFVMLAFKLFIPLISVALGDQSAMPVGVGFLLAWAIVSIGWSLLSVYVMSFKYREWLTWW